MKSLRIGFVGLLLTIVLANVLALTHASLQPANPLNEKVAWNGGTIGINSDGTVAPSDAPIKRTGDTYTLTSDVISTADTGIFVYRSGITIDGDGHWLNSSSGERGIYIFSGNNIKIVNLKISGFRSSVHGGALAQFVEVLECVFVNGQIELNSFKNSIFKSNVFIGKKGARAAGITAQVQANSGNVVSNNTLNGKPIIYLDNVNSRVLKSIDAGQIIIMNSKNVIIDDPIVTAPSVASIFIYNCLNVTIRNSNFENLLFAVVLYKTSNFRITGNSFTDVRYAINLHWVRDGEISGNNITCGSHPACTGIGIYASSSNKFAGNVVSGNYFGISLGSVSDDPQTNSNTFYGNDFDNVHNVYFAAKIGSNKWDDGAKGNYWGDYNGTDKDDNGVGDAPYIIDQSNVDNYPVMKPYRMTRYVSVEVHSPYQDSVKGGGRYPVGANVTVAINDDAIEYVSYAFDNGTRLAFQGWVVNGRIVSTQKNYTFRAEEPVKLEASWGFEYKVEVQHEGNLSAAASKVTVNGAGWFKPGESLSFCNTHLIRLLWRKVHLQLLRHQRHLRFKQPNLHFRSDKARHHLS